MTVNVFLQLVSILFRIITIAYVSSLFKDMKYGFRLIILKAFFLVILKSAIVLQRFFPGSTILQRIVALLAVQGSFIPIDWLSQNILYLYYLIFVVSQFGFVIGLIHQFSLNQVNSMSWEFFYSSPLTTMSTCLIIFELIKRIKEPINIRQ